VARAGVAPAFGLGTRIRLSLKPSGPARTVRHMPPPDVCPACGSALLQALHWDDAVAFRCPECQSCFRSELDRAGLAALEARQATARQALVSAYDTLVGESMAALADCFASAFARDLLTADDFAPRTAAPSCPPHTGRSLPLA
jgi:predicted RNA-binding Zn-ribbon protein involved in translation (DUF1610 family)